MKNIKIIITVLSAFIMSVYGVNGQCDLSNTGIGNFDGSNYNQWAKYDTQSGVKYGTYSQESAKKHSGTHSLKANVTKDNTWQMRILTNCDYPLANGKEYTISAWLKGDVGDKVKIILQQNNSGNVELGSSTVEISSTNWKKYSVKHKSDGNYSKGKIKLVFQNPGVYYLDDLAVSASGTAVGSGGGGVVTPIATGSSWYVKGGNGKDNTSSGNGKSPSKPLNSLGYAIKTAWKPGDKIYVMEGSYRNSNYGTVQSSGGKSGFNNPPFLTINRSDINTSKDNWLIITNYPGDKPKIQFDGESGIVLRDGVSYVDISGLEIEGANQKITKKQAIANRTVQHKYFGGQGIAVWGGSKNPHHIKIHHMKVHDCGGSGIRVNDGDYIDLSYNEVYNCNWYTWLGSSAIVIAQSKDFDKLSKIKMVLTHNLVHDNRNFVPFYCCEVSPTSGDYGTIRQNYIHDGSGVYITRNNPGTPWQSKTDYLYGWFYFANNVTYNNGINGLVVHKTDRTIVTNNIAYMNGTVDPRPVSQGGDGRQAAGGITINASKKVYMYNNISQVRHSSDYNYRTFGDVSYTASNNIGIHGNSNFKAGSDFIKLTPTSDNAKNLFVNPSNGDFHPKASSITIDAGKNHSDLPPFDFDGNPRNGSPDIGAYEYTTGIVVTPTPTPTPSGGPDGYTFAANEKETVNVSGTVNIAYGANGKFNFLKNVSSNTTCNNATFGDPVPGVVKKCYVQIVSNPDPQPTPTPTPSTCNFGTPTNSGLPSFDRANYTNIFVLGNGPNLSNIKRFRINWNAGSNKLVQFAFNTTNGNPSYYVDLRGKIEQKFSSSNPSVKISGSGIGVDGDYWVTKRGNDFVMASKDGEFSIYCSVTASKPSCTGQKAALQETAIVLYPNPAQETLNVSGLTAENAIVTVSDLLGKVVVTTSLTKDQNSLNVSNLKSGMYFITFTQFDGVTTTKTFMLK